MKEAVEDLKMTAGNFYINDKSTGSVVGQQPFGGGRHSGIIFSLISNWNPNVQYRKEMTKAKCFIKFAGTNDKAGSPQYCLRWTSPQSIKETFVPLREVTYPYMHE